MLSGNYLFAVFSHIQRSYQLLYLFTENGPMTKKSWDDLNLEMVDLKFKNLDRLNEFVLNLGNKLKSKKVYVFSPREFNQVVENIEKGEQFLDVLKEKGRPLDKDSIGEKSTFWDQF